MTCQKDPRLSDMKCGEYILDCLKVTTPGSVSSASRWTSWLVWIAIMGMIVVTLLTGGCAQAWGASFTTETSYYTVKSCLAEGTSGIMANGERLDDEALTAASWDYKFGTLLRVTNQRNGRSVVVKVCDRGPSKRLYKRGRRIDLSKKAFETIEETRRGLAVCTIERIGG